MKQLGNVRLFFIGLGIVAIQIILLRHLEIFGSTSDLVLLFLVWLCTKKNKVACLIFAAILGLFQDALTDLWGLHIFSKTLLVFILHGYLNRIKENQLLFWQGFLIILMCAFIHNLTFFGVSIFSGLHTTGVLTFSLLLYSPLYTSIVGSFLHLVKEDL